MAHLDLTAFGSWSAVTAVFVIVTSLVYRKFTKRNKDEPHQA
jgi:hypothetical protein